MVLMNWFQAQLSKVLFTPIKALKWRYVPLLLIYFAYGASGFASIAITFWEKENLTLSAEQFLTISVWVSLPWTIKMIAGQFVDAVPLLGNRRRSYVYLGAVFVALYALILVGLAGKYDWAMNFGSEYTLYLAAALCSAIGFMIQDVTADTMSTEVVPRYDLLDGKKIPRKKSDIEADLAMVQILGRLALSIAGVLVAGIGGIIAKHFAFETVAWMILVIPVISVLGATFVRLESHETEEISRLDPKILGGGVAFGVFSVLMAFSEVLYAQEIVFLVSFVLLSLMMYWITKESPKQKVQKIFLTLAVIFLYRIMPGTGPGFSWWAIDVLEFDQVFFGVLAQVGALIALATVWFLSDFIAHKSVRAIFLFLVVFGTILDLPELLLYYNVHEMLGLSAKSVALVDNTLGSPLTHISMIPMLTVIALYAPPRHRATWFAVAASMMNLAMTGAKLFTKYLNKIFVVSREVLNDAGEIVTQADYSQLGHLMVTKTIIGLIIPLVAIFAFLNPRRR